MPEITSALENGSTVADTHRTCHHRIFAMTCEEFDQLRERSGERCEICGMSEQVTTRGVLCIDHDHRYGTGAVRGLVCDPCNALMRRVDNGDRKPPDAVIEYCRNAWFVELQVRRSDHSPLRKAHPDWKLWQEFGHAAGSNRRQVTKDFINWYLRRGTRLPTRP